MDYEQFKIKRFDLWDLYLHTAQYPYLGRCYASAIRKDAEQVLDMNSEENKELFVKIIPLWKKAVSESYGNVYFNLLFMGNTWRHLHVHLIPRFIEPKSFYGISFEDPNPKGNYSPYPKKEISADILLRIKEDIKDKL